MEATLTAMGKQARAEAVYDETAGSAGTVN
jgi:hypothetical protein